VDVVGDQHCHQRFVPHHGWDGPEGLLTASSANSAPLVATDNYRAGSSDPALFLRRARLQGSGMAPHPPDCTPGL